MKFRNGFVSNSSTQSFIIGVHGNTKDDLRHQLHKAFFDTFLVVKKGDDTKKTPTG